MELVKLVNPFQPSVVCNIETGHLFCSAKQTTGFYMKCNIALKWVNKESQGPHKCHHNQKDV